MRRLTRTALLAALLCLLCAAARAQTPCTTQYPVSLDTAVTLCEAKDGSLTTLSASVTTASDSMTVSSTGRFPATGSLVVDNEIIFYTSKTATQFLGLLRGREGTPAAAHLASAVVRGPILAVHHNNQNEAIMRLQRKLGAGAALPPMITGAILVSQADGSTVWDPAPEIDCTNCSGLPVLVGGGGVSNPADTIVEGDNDANGTGRVILRTRNTERFAVENDGSIPQIKRQFGYADARSFGVRCDGTTNNDAAMEAAIASAVVNGRVLFLPEGTCKFTTPMAANIGSNSLRIKGAGQATRVLIATGAAGPGWTISGGERVVFEDLVFTGTEDRKSVV
jgi:hypothetical protein